MESKQNLLILAAVIGAVIFVSGCTGGLDPQALATSNSMIQQFMQDHPNAQIKVTHFTAEQAKNIIDQIRSDCDNPYLDEKEFYRVNVSDPDTNFFAVVWIDWANRSIECVYKIGTEGKTIEKPTEAGCENHASYKCDSGNLYWFDSCGNKQDKKEYCQNGCLGQQCAGQCASHAEYRCYGDNVYWFDSCGNKQDKKEYCDYGCENSTCDSAPAVETCEEEGGYCIVPATAAGSAGASGMFIVTTVTTATSTQVLYQCKAGYEMAKYFCKEGGVCCIPTDNPPSTGFCGKSTDGPCSSDSDCVTGGCSGEICQSVKDEPAVSSCVYADCYDAQEYGMACKCVKPAASVTGAMTAESTTAVTGQCMWTGGSQACTDSDGGRNYYEQGTATANGQSLTDHCNSDGTLTEKYCLDGQVQAEVYKCPYGCTEGACVKSCPQYTPPSPNWCTNGTIVQGGTDENGCQLPPACKICSGSGAFCGGIAGIQCCSGLTCQLDGTYPDAGGKCAEAVCPQYSPPSPDWCNNGTIASGGVDSNGCQKPPICIAHSGDCGTDIDCMISASGSCSPSKANYTVTTTSFGINQTTKTYMEIMGLDAASGKCIFFLRTERIELGFPPGTSQQTIDQYRQLYSQLEGRYGTCKFNAAVLTGALTSWKLSGLFTPTGTADCQGSYFSQAL